MRATKCRRQRQNTSAMRCRNSACTPGYTSSTSSQWRAAGSRSSAACISLRKARSRLMTSPLSTLPSSPGALPSATGAGRAGGNGSRAPNKKLPSPPTQRREQPAVPLCLGPAGGHARTSPRSFRDNGRTRPVAYSSTARPRPPLQRRRPGVHVNFSAGSSGGHFTSRHPGTAFSRRRSSLCGCGRDATGSPSSPSAPIIPHRDRVSRRGGMSNTALCGGRPARRGIERAVLKRWTIRFVP